MEVIPFARFNEILSLVKFELFIFLLRISNFFIDSKMSPSLIFNVLCKTLSIEYRYDGNVALGE